MLFKLNNEKQLFGRFPSRLLILIQHIETTILVTSHFHNCICEVCYWQIILLDRRSMYQSAISVWNMIVEAQMTQTILCWIALFQDVGLSELSYFLCLIPCQFSLTFLWNTNIIYCNDFILYPACSVFQGKLSKNTV